MTAMKTIPGGVTAPSGFSASGLSAGIKQSGKKDLALIYSDTVCDAAGVFTTNTVQASCVAINKEHLKSGKAQAILANSGNANCMTGERGFADSQAIISAAAGALGIPEDLVCIAATGVIGAPLPLQNILNAISPLVQALGTKSADAAEAIMTTDTVPKETAVEFSIGGVPVRIGAIAKGAGMIHPAMALPKGAFAKGLGGPKHATMLCFATTDAVIEGAALREALQRATEESFNMITVDGDMSTNDMALILASGAAGNEPVLPGTPAFAAFCAGLAALFLSLAKQMVRDAEGATKFAEITVQGAKSKEDARLAARGIASSTLLKCALYGEDPNWGRVAAAAGHSGAKLDASLLRISLGDTLVLEKGAPAEYDAAALQKEFSKKDIFITVDLGLGTDSATAYTCDLSKQYVEINSAYRT